MSLDTLHSIISGVRVAMITTHDSTGALTSRPLTTLDTEVSGNAWFLTAADSDFAREIDIDPLVNVAWAGSDQWASVAGRASIVDDQAKKAELWNDFVEAWFPDGTTDPGVVLVKVEGDSAQYWDSPGKAASLLDMVKARLTGTQAGDVGDSGTIDLDPH